MNPKPCTARRITALLAAFTFIGCPTKADPLILEGKVLQVVSGRKAMLLDVQDKTVFVAPAPKGIYEGDEFRYWVEPAGDAEYKTVLGADKVIPGFRLLNADEVERLEGIERGRAEREKKRGQAYIAERDERIRQEAVMQAADAARIAADKADAKARKQRGIDEKASDFLRTRVGEGSADAAYDLAVRYIEGKGVEKDPQETWRLMNLSASRGNADAAGWLKTNKPPKGALE